MNRKRNSKRNKSSFPKIVLSGRSIKSREGIYVVKKCSVSFETGRKKCYRKLTTNISREKEEETIKKLRELIERIERETKDKYTKEEVIDLIIGCIDNESETTRYVMD